MRDLSEKLQEKRNDLDARIASLQRAISARKQERIVVEKELAAMERTANKAISERAAVIKSLKELGKAEALAN
ncbi:MAG: hypothetical protein M1539_06025 [Actinobacteria bacterium]|nr:hypothetical protein [Actinomycetota bacterium]